MKPPESSPWPRRVIIAGFSFSLLGFIILFSNGSSIDAMMNPETSHIVKSTGESSEVIELEAGCYRLMQIKGEPTLNATLMNVDGSNVVGEPITENNCMKDTQSMNASLVQTGAWQISAGTYSLDISCDDDCNSATSWFISVNAMQEAFFGNTGLILGSALCCLSILIIPLGFILQVSNARQKHSNVVLMNEQGQPLVLQNLPPHIAQQIQQEVQLNQNQQQQVAPPFSDTGLAKPPPDNVRDGTMDVQQGKLMTTEQIYALMRGDVEGAQQPRFQTTQENEKVMDEAANAAAITSWDEGAPSSFMPNPMVTETQEKIKQRTQTPQNEPSSSWKDWDEMN